MNEMKLLETQLRSWTPRRPSARLERRIFGETPVESGARAWRAEAGRRRALRVLIPAAACLILTLAMLNQPDHTGASASAGQDAIMVLSLSNQSYAAYLPGSFACEANRWDTFRWTNGGASPSSAFSISPGKTND